MKTHLDRREIRERPDFSRNDCIRQSEGLMTYRRLRIFNNCLVLTLSVGLSVSLPLSVMAVPTDSGQGQVSDGGDASTTGEAGDTTEQTEGDSGTVADAAEAQPRDRDTIEREIENNQTRIDTLLEEINGFDEKKTGLLEDLSEDDRQKLLCLAAVLAGEDAIEIKKAEKELAQRLLKKASKRKREAQKNFNGGDKSFASAIEYRASISEYLKADKTLRLRTSELRTLEREQKALRKEMDEADEAEAAGKEQKDQADQKEQKNRKSQKDQETQKTDTSEKASDRGENIKISSEDDLDKDSDKAKAQNARKQAEKLKNATTQSVSSGVRISVPSLDSLQVNSGEQSQEASENPGDPAAQSGDPGTQPSEGSENAGDPPAQGAYSGEQPTEGTGNAGDPSAQGSDSGVQSSEETSDSVETAAQGVESGGQSQESAVNPEDTTADGEDSGAQAQEGAEASGDVASEGKDPNAEPGAEEGDQKEPSGRKAIVDLTEEEFRKRAREYYLAADRQNRVIEDVQSLQSEVEKDQAEIDALDRAEQEQEAEEEPQSDSSQSTVSNGSTYYGTTGTYGGTYNPYSLYGGQYGAYGDTSNSGLLGTLYNSLFGTSGSTLGTYSNLGLYGSSYYTYPNSAYSTLTSSAALGQAVANYAVQFVGRPYVWGGTSLTNGCDCSGFVQQIFKAFGVELSRTTYTQAKEGREVSYSEMQPGDVINYGSHTAIYIGNNRIVHAANEDEGIIISDNPAYKPILTIRRYV